MIVSRWVAVAESKHGTRGIRSHVILGRSSEVACGALAGLMDEARTNSTKPECATCEAAFEAAVIADDARFIITRELSRISAIGTELARQVAASAVDGLLADRLLADSTAYEYLGGAIPTPRMYGTTYEPGTDELPPGVWGTEERARNAISLAEQLWDAEKAKRPYLKRGPILRLVRRRKQARHEIIE